MAFKQISSIYFLADTKEDLTNIPAKTMGAECFVIKDAMEYKQTSTGEWYPQTKTMAAGGGSSEQVQADWNQGLKTAVDFIQNKPFGVEYDEKIQIENPSEYSAHDWAIYDDYEIHDPYGNVVYAHKNTTDNGFILINQFNGRIIFKYDFYGPGYDEGMWHMELGVVYGLINSISKRLNFDYLPIQQLDWLSSVNPAMEAIVAPETGDTITAQQAYDYAVSVNNNLLLLIEQYNNLIGQLNTKGYVNQE